MYLSFKNIWLYAHYQVLALLQVYIYSFSYTKSYSLPDKCNASGVIGRIVSEGDGGGGGKSPEKRP